MEAAAGGGGAGKGTVRTELCKLMLREPKTWEGNILIMSSLVSIKSAPQTKVNGVYFCVSKGHIGMGLGNQDKGGILNDSFIVTLQNAFMKTLKIALCVYDQLSQAPIYF